MSIEQFLRWLTQECDSLAIMPVENDETGEVGFEAKTSSGYLDGPIGYGVTAEGALRDLIDQLEAAQAAEAEKSDG